MVSRQQREKFGRHQSRVIAAASRASTSLQRSLGGSEASSNIRKAFLKPTGTYEESASTASELRGQLMAEEPFYPLPSDPLWLKVWLKAISGGTSATRTKQVNIRGSADSPLQASIRTFILSSVAELKVYDI